MNSAYKRTKAFVLSIVLFFGALFIIGCFVLGIKNLCSAFQGYETPINRVYTKDKKVALTFDVAWGSENIEEILDILDKHNAKATFFLVGSWVDDNEELVKEIHNRGHEIGNHSNTHSSFPDISNKQKIEEIISTGNKIEDLTGEKTNLFRPPFGKVDKETMNTCKSLGYYTIKWDVDSGDWKNIGPVHVVDALTNLEKKDYSMVTVSNLIYKNNYKINSFGEQSFQEDD